MAYTVKIDRDSCISSGTCVADSPTAFDFDDEDIAITLPGITEVPDDRILRIARNCPAGAILLFDESGAEIDLFA